MLPVETLLAMFEVDVELEVLADFSRADPLHPAEQAHIQKSVKKRQLEFAAGRSCARRALARAGCVQDAPLVPLGDRRVPWPQGFTGSISHADGVAAAVVAPLSRIQSIGIDVEARGRVLPNLYSHVADEGEVAFIRSGGAEENLRATQLFCAKEAFYKAQYPLTETFLGFHDVRYTQTDDGFVIEVLAEVPLLDARGGRFAGRLAASSDHVWAGLAFTR